MIDDANYLPKNDAQSSGDTPIVAAVVEEKRFPWLLISLVFAGGLLLLFVALGFMFLFVLGGGMTGGGPSARIAGTWIHVDEPPSRPAKALMSIGTEVISDRVYEFSRFGSVTQKFHGRFSGPPIKGKWRMAPDQDGADDEFTILMEFPDRDPVRMHIRFIDRENAEFRMHHSYGDTYYKVK